MQPRGGDTHVQQPQPNTHALPERPLVSVIVPVHDVLPYLGQALDSVLAQTYRDLEVIVVDDGSTDGSGELCDEYARRDGRLTVIHQENRGLSAARNVGIDRATGDWILFLDSDDWMEPNAAGTNTPRACSEWVHASQCGGQGCNAI